MKTTRHAKFLFDPTMWWSRRIPPENTISGVHVSEGSAETLVRRGGITKLITIRSYFLSNISAKNYQTRMMCVEVIVSNINVVFETQCVTTSIFV